MLQIIRLVLTVCMTLKDDQNVVIQMSYINKINQIHINLFNFILPLNLLSFKYKYSEFYLDTISPENIY